jgi:hypothetical protein
MTKTLFSRPAEDLLDGAEIQSHDHGNFIFPNRC